MTFPHLQTNFFSDLSEEQEPVVSSNAHAIVIQAYAGTGKTHTLRKYALARKGYRILYLAYNASMAADAKKAFREMPWVQVYTMHGLAYSAFGKQHQDRFGDLRPIHVAERYFEGLDERESLQYANVLIKMLRDFLSSAESMEEFEGVAMLHTVKYRGGTECDVAVAFERLPRLWNDIVSGTEEIPFEHDVYLKQYQLSNPLLDYDIIMVDEAQDVSPVMLDIVERQDAGKVFVGDSYQQIYGWRGAVDSLGRVDAEEYHYLTKSYRCPEAIARLANRYLRMAGAPKSFIGNASGGAIGGSVSGHKTIIARTNAGILKLISENPDASFYFVGGIKGYNFQELIDIKALSLNKREYIRSPFIERFKTFDDLKEYASLSGEAALETKIKTATRIPRIGEAYKNAKKNQVKRAMDADFILTTAHKSKGLEWDSVKLLDDFPNLRNKAKDFFEKTAGQISRAEINLLYVACTRAKKQLMFEDMEMLPDESMIGFVSKALA